MTKTKTIMGISLAAIFAVTMIASQTVSADGSHLDLIESEIKMNSDAITEAEIETAGDIPEINTDPSFFGYAIVTDGVLVAATTHNGFFDSETQDEENPDGVWHVHMVEATTDTACASGVAIARVSFEENGTVEVEDDEIEFSDISRDALDLTNALTGDVEEFKLGQPNGVVASFTISTVGAGETFEVCLDNLNPLEPTSFESETEDD